MELGLEWMRLLRVREEALTNELFVYIDKYKINVEEDDSWRWKYSNNELFSTKIVRGLLKMS